MASSPGVLIITALREAEVELARNDDRPMAPSQLRGSADYNSAGGTAARWSRQNSGDRRINTARLYAEGSVPRTFYPYLLPFVSRPEGRKERAKTAPSGSNIIPISRLNHEALRRRREKAQRERRENMLI